jgi:hypothetical protein
MSVTETNTDKGKQQYVIYDNTANRKPYIAESYENTGDPDSAMKFDTFEDAQKLIDKMEWSEWAFVIKL